MHPECPDRPYAHLVLRCAGCGRTITRARAVLIRGQKPGDEFGEVTGYSFGLLPQHEVAGVLVDTKPGAGDGCGEQVSVLRRQ